MGMSTVTVAAVGATAGAVGAISGYFIGARGKESEAAACPEFATGDLYKGKKPKKKKEPAAAGEGNIIDMGVADDGAKLFKAKCATCHSVNEGGPTKQGPNLYGIMGSKAAVRTPHPHRCGRRSCERMRPSWTARRLSMRSSDATL